MALVACKCPNCGGTVQMEEDLKSGFCIYCGSKIINVRNLNDPVTIDKGSDIINHLKIAKDHLTAHDWNASAKVVESVFLMDPDCQDAYFMKALLEIRNRTKYEEIMAKKGNKPMNSYGIFSEEDIKKCWGECNLYITYKGAQSNMAHMNPNFAGWGIMVKVDEKESFIADKNCIAHFGTNPGKHTISVAFCSGNSTGNLSGMIFGDTETVSITASKDHRFEVDGFMEVKTKYDKKELKEMRKTGAMPNMFGYRLKITQIC